MKNEENQKLKNLNHLEKKYLEMASIGVNVVADSVVDLMDRNKQYNLEMLDEDLVLPITNHLLNKDGLSFDKEQIWSGNISKSFEEEVDQLSALLYAVKTNKKPQIIQLSNEKHWITACLLPVGENDVTVVSMNSVTHAMVQNEINHTLESNKTYVQEILNAIRYYEEELATLKELNKEKELKKCEDELQGYKDALQDINSVQQQIREDTYKTSHDSSLMIADDFQTILRSIEGYSNLTVNKIDVEGQQRGACCGLTAAMNSVSIIKTFQKDFQYTLPTNSKGEFDVEKFKNANNSNVMYQLNKEGKLELNGVVNPNIEIGIFLKTIGGKILGDIENDFTHNNSEIHQLATKMAREMEDKEMARMLANEFEAEDLRAEMEDKEMAQVLANEFEEEELRTQMAQEIRDAKMARMLANELKEEELRTQIEDAKMAQVLANKFKAEELRTQMAQEAQVTIESNELKIQSLKDIKEHGLKGYNSNKENFTEEEKKQIEPLLGNSWGELLRKSMGLKNQGLNSGIDKKIEELQRESRIFSERLKNKQSQHQNKNFQSK